VSAATASALNSACAEKRGIEADLAAENERIAKLIAESDAAEEERRALVDSELAAAGQRLLDGEAAAPSEPKTVKRVRELTSTIEATNPAIEICRRREAELLAKLAQAKETVASFQYRYIRERHDEAAEAVRRLLSDMLPHLAALMAADACRKRIDCDALKLTSEDVRGDFSGSFVVDRMLIAISDFVRPPCLQKQDFKGAVDESKRELLAEFEGESP
jgi:hypothetical protein